jgi:shikimate dehydrogenase
MATQDKAFGLLGRTLGHSWSPQIHARLGLAGYQLFEREPDEARDFLRSDEWQGLNVTIPYKRLAAEMAQECSPRVEALGVANTLVRTPEGTTRAENTDVLGFAAMLDGFCQCHFGQDSRTVLEGRKALVLGTGGAAQAVAYALRTQAKSEVCFVSRTGASTYENLLDLHRDASLIVNTTPVGMYPNCPASPLADGMLEQMGQLAGVLDVVYNPLRTGICLQAEQVGLPFESGLAMLVWQALYASELFQRRTLDELYAYDILRDLHREQCNVVLIGMPGAGKTSAGRRLAALLDRPFVDLDDAFAVEEGMSAGDYIELEGEARFREKERDLAARYGARSGQVIACGGGIVTRPCNYESLHQNGTIVFIDRPLYQLTSDGRPLSQRKGIEQLANERMDLYVGWADKRISCTGSAEGDALLIKGRLGL